jgi:hypothetical protein
MNYLKVFCSLDLMIDALRLIWSLDNEKCGRRNTVAIEQGKGMNMPSGINPTIQYSLLFFYCLKGKIIINSSKFITINRIVGAKMPDACETLVQIPMHKFR